MKHRKADIQAVLDRDPATRSRLEAVLCCPGYRAVRRHRRAHFFYKHGMRLIARMISERTRRLTGIDIHPGAQIGEGFFIDTGHRRGLRAGYAEYRNIRRNNNR